MAYNIEFAHIYADKEFGKEQETSIEVLKETISELKEDFVTCILFDEFSPDVKSLNEEDYLKKVSEFVNVDFVAHESDLQKVAQKVIEDVNKSKIKEESFGDKKNLLLIKDDKKIGLLQDGKPTCSLLIAAWALCRLGIYEVKTNNLTNKEFRADKLITILPEKYRESEKKVIDILSSTKHADVLNNIQYEFF